MVGLKGCVLCLVVGSWLWGVEAEEEEECPDFSSGDNLDGFIMRSSGACGFC